MNTSPDYFEFYELPVQFHPDLNAIKTRFYAFSKKFHPDFYANESEARQQEVLELSTLNNKVYQVLSHPQKRLKYILELKGVISGEEAYQLPQAFLMEMMDVNEALMDLQFEPDAEKSAQLNENVESIERQLNEELNSLTQAFDEQAGQSEELLASIKDIFYRQKYIARIKEKL